MPEASRAAALAAARRARGRTARQAGGGGAATPRYQAKRETILDAAAQRFNAQGLRGATLADIAADVGLVTTSITYYYRRKEALAAACYERAIDVHLAAAQQALLSGQTPGPRITAFLMAEAALPSAMASGEIPPLINFSDLMALPEGIAEGVFDRYTAMFRAVRALLETRGAATSPAQRAALNASAHLLLSITHWLRSWLARYEDDDHPRVARRVADLALHGLGATGSVWPEPAELARVAMPSALAMSGDLEGMDEAFLRAATDLVNEQGYRGASVDRISARLQVTKGAFYHHIDTKLDLISACFDRTHALIRQTLRAAEQGHGQAWLRACAATDALVRFQLGPAGPLLRASAFSALPEAAARTRVRRQAQRLSERLVGILVDGLVDGSLRPHDTALGAQMLATAMNAAAELRRWVPGITAEEATRHYVRPALQGLLVDQDR